MAVSLMMSGAYASLYSDSEMAALFSDSAEMRALLLVEGALALAQGKQGLIPEISGAAIHRAAREVQVDATGLAKEAARDGVAVPAFVAAFRTAMNAPEHAQYIHWGATSQDIIDTALVLRLRRAMEILDERLEKIIADLADAAQSHRDTPIAARTRNQIATPTSLGARITSWAAPLQRHRWRMDQVRARLLMASLSGASGNSATFGDKAREIAQDFAKELGLSVPDLPWHTGRDSLCEFANLLALIAASAAKMAQDLILSAQIDEGISAGPKGASSTMPHKENPTSQEAIVALSRHINSLARNLNEAMIHSQERDGAAWALEWLALPEITVGTAAILRMAAELASDIRVDESKLRATFFKTNGVMMAEAASFALAQHMPLPDARAIVKEACQNAASSGEHLKDILMKQSKYKIDWDTVFDPRNALGDAPSIVDRFVKGLDL